MELTRILANHSHAELRFVTSDRWLGETVERRCGVVGDARRLTYISQTEALTVSRDCEVVFLATPAEVSLELAPKLLEAGTRVVDLSGAFRLRDGAVYPKWYGFTHSQTALLSSAVYGLPELFRSEVPKARLVANPGCYATSAALPLAPLIKAGLIDPASIVINAASGVTGAGRKATEDFSFTEIDGDFRAYRVLRHQHTPEIAQTLGWVSDSGSAPDLVFTPHLLPVKRGILCTTFARLSKGVDAAAVNAALADTYGREPFVPLAASADHVSLKAVVGTNRCQIGVSIDGDRIVLASAIDNLVKGAAGQAVQNFNLLLGCAETEGLSGLRGFHP